MSCLTEMMPLPIVSPSANRVVGHRLLLGVASSSDRSWLHLYEGCNNKCAFSTFYKRVFSLFIMWKRHVL